MIGVLSWNIQWGKGSDGRVDLERIAAHARALGEADVVCLQEVACNFPALDGGGDDQVAVLAALFPGYTPVYGAAVDIAAGGGGRRRFGNLILSRLPVLQAFRHLLPRPVTPDTDHMQRQATEVVLAAGAGILRVVTTHLEYASPVHRHAQVERLRLLHGQWSAHPRVAAGELGGEEAEPDVPPAGRCPTLLCGDLNMESTEDGYARMLAPFADGTPAFVDAWNAVYPGVAHAPTCGIYERKYWDRPHARDFVLVTAELASKVSSMRVDTETAASDHQPLFVGFDSTE